MELRTVMKRIWWICAAFLHWMSSFVSDRLIFVSIKEHGIFYLGMKMICLLWFLIFWKAVQLCCRGLIQKNAVVIHRIIYGAVYGGILIAILILIWPGVWRTDEFGILGNATALQIYWWQHFLTSILYILAFMMIPVPSGIIIIQILLISVGFAYLAQVTEQKTQIKWGGMFLLIPFCVPSAIMFHLYPMRITLYAMLELLILTYIYEREENRGSCGIKNGQMVLLACGTAVLANWRAESIYYALFLPIAIIAVLNKLLTRKQKVLFLVMTAFLTVCIYGIQSHGIHAERKDAYEMTAYAQSLLPLVQAACEDNDRQGLEIVDKVIDVNAVLKAAEEGKDGIDSFWNGDMNSKTYSEAEFADFKRQYYKWIVQYWKIYLKERTANFLTSYDQTQNTTDLYDSENIQFVYFLQVYFLTKPFFPGLRAKIIGFMELKIWYVFEISIMALLFNLFYGIRRNRKLAILTLLILLRVPLIYLTAPDNFFMYYYPFFLEGNIVMVSVAVKAVKNYRDKQHRNKKKTKHLHSSPYYDKLFTL